MTKTTNIAKYFSEFPILARIPAKENIAKRCSITFNQLESFIEGTSIPNEETRKLIDQVTGRKMRYGNVGRIKTENKLKEDGRESL